MNAKLIMSRLRAEKGHTRSYPTEGARTDKIATLNSTCRSVHPELSLFERPIVIELVGLEPIRVTLLEDPAGVTASGTGATLWDAALVLTRYFLVERNVFNMRIIELGSGLGLPSIALAAQGNDVIATERDITMDILEKNIEANRNLVTSGQIKSLEMSWNANIEDIRMKYRSTIAFDIIIGSDLVFPRNEDAWEPLAATYHFLLECGTQSPRGCIGYLAYEHRRDDVIKRFTTILSNRGIRCVRCVPSVVECPPDISLYELSLAPECFPI